MAEELTPEEREREEFEFLLMMGEQTASAVEPEPPSEPETPTYGEGIFEGIKIPEDPYSASEILGGAEPLVTMASGVPAVMVSGLAGTGDIIRNQLPSWLGGTETSLDERQAMMDAIQNRFTYQPRTSSGQRNMRLIGAPFEAYSEHVAKPAGESWADATGSPMMGTVAETIMEAPDVLFGMKAGSKIGRMPSDEVKFDPDVGRIRKKIQQGAEIVGKPLGKAGKVVDAIIGAPVRIPKKGVEMAWHLIEPRLRGEDATVGRMVNQLTGNYRDEIIRLLESAEPGVTAGQAAVGSGSRTFSALDRLAGSWNPDPRGAMFDAQRQVRADRLTDTFGTPEDVRVGKEILEETAGPKYAEVRGHIPDPRSAEQRFADMAERARQRAARAEEGKVAAMQDEGRMQTMAAQSEQLAKGEPPITGTLRDQSGRAREPDGVPVLPREPDMNAPPRYKGEVRAPARYAPQTQTAAQARAAADEFKDVGDVRRQAEQTHTEISEAMLNEAMYSSDVGLGSFLDRPTIQRAINKARDASLDAGYYWPKKGEPYTIGNLQRIKQEVRTVISEMRVKAGNISAKREGELTGMVNSFNDWIRSKSRGYAAADDLWSAGQKKLDQLKIGQLFKEKLDGVIGSEERARVFATAYEDASKIVKDVIGSDVPLEQVLNESQLAVIRKIKSEIDRDFNLKRQATEASPAARRAFEKAVPRPSEHLPKILERGFVVANNILNRLEGAATERTWDRLSELMRDPHEMARVMREASPTEKAVLDEWTKARNRMAVSGAIAAQPQENR